MQWASNGKEKVSQASIFHLNGVVHKFSPGNATSKLIENGPSEDDR